MNYRKAIRDYRYQGPLTEHYRRAEENILSTQEPEAKPLTGSLGVVRLDRGFTAELYNLRFKGNWQEFQRFRPGLRIYIPVHLQGVERKINGCGVQHPNYRYYGTTTLVESTEIQTTVNCGAVEQSVEFAYDLDQLSKLLDDNQVRAPRELLRTARPCTPRYQAVSHHMMRLVSVLLEEQDPRFLPLAIEAKGLELLYLLLKEYEANTEIHLRRSVNETDREKLLQAREIIASSFRDPPSVGQLAEILDISEWRLMSGFKTEFGQSCLQYAVTLRLEEALRLLKETEKPISTIALEVGYQHPSSFDRAFSRQFKFRPNQVRKHPT